jgi:hypothetical protein
MLRLQEVPLDVTNLVLRRHALASTLCHLKHVGSEQGRGVVETSSPNADVQFRNGLVNPKLDLLRRFVLELLSDIEEVVFVYGHGSPLIFSSALEQPSELCPPSSSQPTSSRKSELL